MAKLTRLASTLTARYFPSQNLTDAFYIDGRLFGKREQRLADITVDKEEKGFFFSVFSHPSISGYEPGMMPPYEPQLREICNEVKFGRKEIDMLISSFLSTAVDITGKMRLQDQENRTPYFSGVIVRDAEAFAVTIGSGLAFLYRNDTLFPLTDAGIPIEPIDSYGNRVGDFYNYCSSKTANALWSNITTLSTDDCIILCNKEVYEALGQRELLRILDESDDQCDAAGTVITQASANMPNVPMQFSISFVENVSADEKKGLFGFKKKQKEDNSAVMSIQSTFDGGVVGAAAEAIAGAGFVTGVDAASNIAVSQAQAQVGAAVVFGDATSSVANSPIAPKVNQEASSENGFVVPSSVPTPDSSVEFLDKSITDAKPVAEVSAEDLMKNVVKEMKETSSQDLAKQQDAVQAATMDVTPASDVSQSPFVSAFNPFDTTAVAEPVATEVVSQTQFVPEEDDSSETKIISMSDIPFAEQLSKSNVKADGIIAAALKEMNVDTNPENKTTDSSDIVFEVKDDTTADSSEKSSDEEEFNPYSVGTAEEMQNAAPLVFGDDSSAEGSTSNGDENFGMFTVPVGDEAKSEVPAPQFDIIPDVETEKEEKLNVDFPTVEKAPEPVKQEDSADFVLPFENPVTASVDDSAKENEDIPQMPVYGNESFDSPIYAVNSEQPVNGTTDNAYQVGKYKENEDAVSDVNEPAPYTTYGSETFDYNDNANGVAPQPQNDQVYVQPTYGEQQYADQSYGQQDYSQQAYSQQAYSQQQYGEQPYSQEQYGEQPYATESYSADSQAASADKDDWIFNILGIDDQDADTAVGTGAATAAAAVGAAPSVASSATNFGQGGNAAMNHQGQRPAGTGAARPTGAPTGAPTSGGAGRRPGYANGNARSGGTGSGRPSGYGSGNGNNRGPKPFYARITRNGYIFLAFVALILICLIIVISLIVKSCNADKKSSTTTTTTTTVATIATTESTAPSVDPTAPIGTYTFSDDTGYRTWWDLFNYVYNVQLENTSDPRIATIIAYNGLDATYVPNSGDSLILPPASVFDAAGTTETTVAGDAQATTTVATTTVAAE